MRRHERHHVCMVCLGSARRCVHVHGYVFRPDIFSTTSSFSLRLPFSGIHVSKRKIAKGWVHLRQKARAHISSISFSNSSGSSVFPLSSPSNFGFGGSLINLSSGICQSPSDYPLRLNKKLTTPYCAYFSTHASAFCFLG